MEEHYNYFDLEEDIIDTSMDGLGIGTGTGLGMGLDGTGNSAVSDNTEYSGYTGLFANDIKGQGKGQGQGHANYDNDNEIEEEIEEDLI